MMTANTTSTSEIVSTEPTAPERTELPPYGYEYLDHTADVQLHAWGSDTREAFEQTAKAMFGYMTDLDCVEEMSTLTIESDGHDLHSALYNFLDEWLFNFSAEPFFIPFKINITEFDRRRTNNDVNEEAIRIKAVGFGDTFQVGKHPQGTEVKAITYSAMQIVEKSDRTETFVIVDI